MTGVRHFYIWKIAKMFSSLGGLEPPTFRLTAERANRLRHRDLTPALTNVCCISHLYQIYLAITKSTLLFHVQSTLN